MRDNFLTAVLALGCLLVVGCCSLTYAKAPSNNRPNGMIEIGDFSVEDLAPVQAKFDELVSGGAKVVVFRINSYGGSVRAGLDFIQAVDEARKRGVRTECVVDYKAMSMGFVFLQAACDVRIMTTRSILLAHSASSDFDRGTAVEIANELAYLQALDRAMSELSAARLFISVEEYRAKTTGRDWTMTWEEALDVGAIDRVVDPMSLPPLYSLQ